ERLQQIRAEQEKTEGTLRELHARWEKEREIVSSIREVRGQLESAGTARAGATRPKYRGAETKAGRLEYRAGTSAGRIADDSRLRGCADCGQRHLGVD